MIATTMQSLRRSTSPARWPMPLRRAVPQRRFPRWHRPIVPLLNYDIARDNSTPVRLFRTAAGIITHDCSSPTPPPPCWPCEAAFPTWALVTFAGVVERATAVFGGCTDARSGSVNRAFCLPYYPGGFGCCPGLYVAGIPAGQVSFCGGDPIDVWWNIYVCVSGVAGNYNCAVEARFSDVPSGGDVGRHFIAFATGIEDICSGVIVVPNDLDGSEWGDPSYWGKLGTATVDLFAGCTP